MPLPFTTTQPLTTTTTPKTQTIQQVSSIGPWDTTTVRASRFLPWPSSIPPHPTLWAWSLHLGRRVIRMCTLNKETAATAPCTLSSVSMTLVAHLPSPYRQSRSRIGIYVPNIWCGTWVWPMSHWIRVVQRLVFREFGLDEVGVEDHVTLLRRECHTSWLGK